MAQEYVAYVRQLPPELMPLVEEYHQACVDDCNWLIWNTNYNATRWISMVKAKGGAQTGVDTIRQGRGKPQTGYLRLLEMGEVERSAEYSVLRPKWFPIFCYFPDVMDYARRILDASNVRPPDQTP